jgi:hypothetical protein
MVVHQWSLLCELLPYPALFAWKSSKRTSVRQPEQWESRNPSSESRAILTGSGNTSPEVSLRNLGLARQERNDRKPGQSVTGKMTSRFAPQIFRLTRTVVQQASARRLRASALIGA